MPASVRKSRRKSGGYDIIDPSGRVKGHSATKTNAQKSANARNAALHGWKPTAQRRTGKK